MCGSKRAIGTRPRVHVRTVVVDHYESFNHGRIGLGSTLTVVVVCLAQLRGNLVCWCYTGRQKGEFAPQKMIERLVPVSVDAEWHERVRPRSFARLRWGDLSSVTDKSYRASRARAQMPTLAVV